MKIEKLKKEKKTQYLQPCKRKSITNHKNCNGKAMKFRGRKIKIDLELVGFKSKGKQLNVLMGREDVCLIRRNISCLLDERWLIFGEREREREEMIDC